MLRRANSTLLLLAFLQLVLLFGAPVNVVGGAQTIATEASANAGVTFVASKPARQEKAAAICSEWTNQENDPEYFVQGSSIVTWRWITPRVHPCRAVDIICRTYPACSAPARGPPAASLNVPSAL